MTNKRSTYIPRFINLKRNIVLGELIAVALLIQAICNIIGYRLIEGLI